MIKKPKEVYFNAEGSPVNKN